MPWTDPILDALAAQPALGYLPGSALAAEPTAIAALALLAYGRLAAAQQAADSLAKMQGENGTVGIRAGESSPGWPTSLAIVVWSALGKASGRPGTDAKRGSPPDGFTQPKTENHREAYASRSPFESNIDRGLAWLLANRGSSISRSPDFGHNPELIGWAYAEQTHSWVEPTSFAVLALKAAGKGREAAAREGVAVLFDRQLPGGGLNYGNTYVLGQLIRSHVQPTGIALLALSGESDGSDKLAKSIAWLRRNIGPETTPLSLGWALLGLRGQSVQLPGAGEWLAGAVRRTQSLHKQALLALAAKGWPA